MQSKAYGPAVPFSVACLGIATFAGMDVLMKVLATEIGAYNTILWRTLIGLALATVMFFWSRASWPAAASLRIHVLRGVITSGMAFLFFWGLVHVPLAEAIGLSFIAPLIALYLAAVLLGETVGRTAVFASLIGFAGALVIVGAKFSGSYGEDFFKGVAAILVSAVLYAYNLILQRQQALIARPIEIAFFQSATMVVVYLLLAPFFAELPPASMAPYLVGAAVLALVSMMMLSWAYALAEARVLIPVEYTAFVWAAIFGWLVFRETVTTATLIGTTLIVVGCLIAARQQPDTVEHVESTAV